MFDAKYVIFLNRLALSNSEFSCLGWQLKDILDVVKDLLPPHVWYGADIETNGEFPWGLGMNSFELKKIGDFSAIRKIAQETDQFQSGVFIAVKKEVNIEEGSINVDTMDPPFESRDVDGVLIEIRAFDTSFFQVYSNDYNLMKKISDKYGVEIDTPQDVARKYQGHKETSEGST